MTTSRISLCDQGPEFSRFVAGFWRLMEWNCSPQDTLAFLKQCLELGITTTDHADIYGNYACEAAFGQALQLEPSIRHQIEIVSKCDIKLVSSARPEHQLNHYDTSKPHIIASAENSLRTLNTDYLDLLLIHRPDPLMNADEVAEAFVALKAAGKVRHFGVSNFTPSQFSLLQSRLDWPLVTNQVEINPINLGVLHDGTLDQLQQQRIAPMAWSCLGGGRLFTEQAPQIVRLRSELQAIAEELGAEDMDQVIYAWILMLPSSPLPIIGSGKIERVRRAVNSASLSMNRQQWFRIWQASTGHPVP